MTVVDIEGVKHLPMLDRDVFNDDNSYWFGTICLYLGYRGGVWERSRLEQGHPTCFECSTAWHKNYPYYGYDTLP